MQNSLLWLVSVHPRKLKTMEIITTDFRSWKTEISTVSLRVAGILLLGIVRIFFRSTEILHTLCMADISDKQNDQPSKRKRQSTSSQKDRTSSQMLPAVEDFPENPELMIEPAAIENFYENFSPFSPRHSSVAPEDALEFPATPEKISDSVERLTKRQRLSILSDVMDELRGEDISDRRESEQFPTARLSEMTSNRSSLVPTDSCRVRRNSARVDLPRKFRDRKFQDIKFNVELDFSNLLPIVVGGIAAKPQNPEISEVEISGFQENEDDRLLENAGDVGNYSEDFRSTKSFVSPNPATRREAARRFVELLTMASRGEAEISGNFHTPLSVRILSN